MRVSRFAKKQIGAIERAYTLPVTLFSKQLRQASPSAVFFFSVRKRLPHRTSSAKASATADRLAHPLARAREPALSYRLNYPLGVRIQLCG